MKKSFSPIHLRRLLDYYDNRSAVDARITWLPPKATLERLIDPKLRQRDRTEILIAAYAFAHGGNSPTSYELAIILGVAHATVLAYIKELLIEDPARAYRRHGKLFLARGRYDHPWLDSQPTDEKDTVQNELIDNED